jgi:Ca-activated chloride channel family protein
MTDGETTSGMDRLTDLQQTIQETGLDYVPIFTIMFGAAKEDEVKAVADYSSARVYDGRTNLIEAFRSAKGNN